MAQVTALSLLGVPGKPRVFAPKSAALAYVSHTKKFLFTAANYGAGVSHYFEAQIRATSGTALVRLYDETSAGAVSGSTLSTTSATIVRLRSGALTLTDGNEYVAQFGKAPADSADKLAADVLSY